MLRCNLTRYTCTIMYHHVESYTKNLYVHLQSLTIIYNHLHTVYVHTKYKLVMIWTFFLRFFSLRRQHHSPLKTFPFRSPETRRSMDILCEAGA